MRHAFNSPYTIFVNGINIDDFGALVENYRVGGTPVENSIFLGRNRTTPKLLSYSAGMRPISISIFYAADSQRRLALNKSELDALLVGLPELHMPDGFYYSCSVASIGDLQMLGVEGNQMIAVCEYSLLGIRHDELQTVHGNRILARGTMPRMDAVLSCVSSVARETLQVGPVTFVNVPDGATVVANGMTGELQVNGEPAAGAIFTHLPYLVPGDQTIICPETLTIQYYPTWI